MEILTMLTNLGDWRRTHSCGCLTESNINEEVLLMGWVQRRRDHGGVRLIFFPVFIFY